MTVKNILFIGLSSVGDVVMTTPVLQSLHNKYPEALFDIVTDKRSIALYENYPYKNKLYIKNKNKFLRGAPELISSLWKKRYDIIVDLRTDGLAYLLRSKKRYTKWSAVSYGPHAVEELLGVIASLHRDEPIPHPHVWLSESNYAYADKIISTFKNKKRILALSVGDPNKPFKTWSTDNFVKLLNKYKNDFSGVIFLGGDSEMENTLKVLRLTNLPYVNVVGNNLLDTAALIQKARLYIGPDSGLGHIASALEIPTISFFSVFKPTRYRPWGNKAICLTGAEDDARNITYQEVSVAVRDIING